MNDLSGLYGGVDMTSVLYGSHARHVPAWLYVQDAGPGMVSFVGASRTPGKPHPLAYGDDWTHHFVIGELIVRPHVVIGTNALRGTGLGGLATGAHDIHAMLADGAIVAADAKIQSFIGR